MDTILKQMDQYGIPLVLLVLVLVALAWALRKVCQWLKPYVERLIESHLSFVASAEKSMEGQEKSLSAQGTRLDSFQVSIDEFHEANVDKVQRLTRIEKKIDLLPERIRNPELPSEES